MSLIKTIVIIIIIILIIMFVFNFNNQENFVSQPTGNYLDQIPFLNQIPLYSTFRDTISQYFPGSNVQTSTTGLITNYPTQNSGATGVFVPNIYNQNPNLNPYQGATGFNNPNFNNPNMSVPGPQAFNNNPQPVVFNPNNPYLQNQNNPNMSVPGPQAFNTPTPTPAFINPYLQNQNVPINQNTGATGMSNIKRHQKPITPVANIPVAAPAINTNNGTPITNIPVVAPITNTNNTSVPITSNQNSATWLNSINSVRATVGQSPVIWNQTIANEAQQHANLCVFQHSNPLQELNNVDLGENLWAGTANSYAIPEIVNDWASEKASYTYPNTLEQNEQQTSAVVGHYTQLVNKNVTQVGCGCSPSCTTGDMNGMQLCSCNFLPIQLSNDVPY
jgi:uncharacterized protein YkwD